MKIKMRELAERLEKALEYCRAEMEYWGDESREREQTWEEWVDLLAMRPIEEEVR